MGLLKKNQDQAVPLRANGSGGRALPVYFMPAVVVAVLLMLAVAVLAQQAMQQNAAVSARSAAQSVVATLAGRLEGVIEARRDLVQLALSDRRAAIAFAGDDADALRAVETDLQRRIPGITQVRLLPRDVNQPDPSGPAPLGYAGLDMLRRTVETGRASAAEIHQIKSGAPYLAMALPVAGDKGVAGVLFAAWDIRPLIAVVENSPAFPGRLQLVQGGDSGYVLGKGPGSLEGPLNDGSVAVPSTIWEVAYAVMPDSGFLGNLTTMLALVGAGAVALLLTALMQWRALARDLRADMGSVVSLGEAIARRETVPQPHPRLAAVGDAVALLCQYARDVRGALPAAAAIKQAVPAAAVQQATHGLDVEEIDSDPAELLATGGGQAVGQPPQMDIAASLFRAYDVRGVVGETLTPAIAEVLGKALATLVQEQGGRKVAVARDARLSSPELAEALIAGLNACGCDVLDIGQAPTPLLYFAMHTQPVQAGVMVTGSHNPSSYNGFKIVIGERVLDGKELMNLRQRMLDGVFNHGSGNVEDIDLLGEYVDAVNAEVQLARPLKVVVDAGNGVAGELATTTLETLGCEVVPLFCEPDGTFPNHHPDPSIPENLASLVLEVQAQEADLGIALDGDGDRLGVVDNEGNTIWADRLLMLLAADVLGRHPGVDILYDVKSSRHLASFVLSHGGRPIMWQSGHSRMRAKMLETGALLGGEFSGHLFIKERWYGFDDAIYAAVRLLEIMALEPRSAAELFSDIPSSPSSPEYQLMLEEGQSAELMRALDAHKVFDDARLVELDGLRVEFADGWGLIRPSNTTPSLTFRFEADDAGTLEQIKARFRDLLQRVAPDLQAPF